MSLTTCRSGITGVIEDAAYPGIAVGSRVMFTGAGAVFPDYELTAHTGKCRKPSDLEGPDSMILVFSPGGIR